MYGYVRRVCYIPTQRFYKQLNNLRTRAGSVRPTGAWFRFYPPANSFPHAPDRTQILASIPTPDQSPGLC